VKWLNGAKLEDLEDVLIISIRQVNAKNGTETDEVMKEQAKVLGQQMNVTNFVHKKWYVFCF
jgi:urease gamma subunit